MEIVKIGYWFGHYDSRGGSHLIMGVRTEEDAAVKYMNDVFCMIQEEDEEFWSDVFSNFKDELMATIVVRFFEEVTENIDLIYDDVCWGMGFCKKDEVEHYQTADGEWHTKIPNGANGVSEIWIGRNLPNPPDDYELVDLDQFGEDSCGVVLQF